MRITRTIAPLALAGALLVTTAAAASARPIRDPEGGTVRAVPCTALGPIVAGRPRQTHRVLCRTSAATADSPASTPRAVTVRNAPSDVGFAWQTVAIALAGAGFMLSAAALITGRQRRSNHRQAAL